MASTAPSPNSTPSAVPPAASTRPPPPQPLDPPTSSSQPNATSPSTASPPPSTNSTAPPPASLPPPTMASPPPPTTSPPPQTLPPPPADAPPPSATSPPPPPPPPVSSPPVVSPPPRSNPPGSSPPSPPPPPLPSPNPPSSSPPPPNPPSSSPPPPSATPPRSSPPPPSQPPKNSPPPPLPKSPESSPPRPPSSPVPKISPSPPETSPPPRQTKPPPASNPPQISPHPPASAPPKISPSPPIVTPPPASPPTINSTPKSPPPPVIRPSPPPTSLVAPPAPSQIPVSPSSDPTTNNTSSTAPTNSNSKGNGGIGSGGAVAIGLVLGLILLSLIGTAAFCMRKRKKKIAGLNGGYVMPTSLASSPKSDSGLLKVQMSAPLNGSGSSNAFVYSPTEPGGLGHSRSWFTYEELVEATNGFSVQNLLGEGGFGCVYKGYLPDGREIAVKQLKIGGGQGEREFKAEVEIISRIHHRHLVSLVGYCISQNQRLLVYDYVSNNNLYFHLHGEGRPVLDWATRVKVAAGAARGLAYLHEDCHPRIIHRDIKSSNILLDNNLEARVSDFGLAKLALDANSHVTTRVMGTFGYMAPEYASSGKLTEKSDVFSFGVVLLELITGRKPVDASQPLGDESLVEWVAERRMWGYSDGDGNGNGDGKARPLLNHALETEEFEGLADPRLEKNFADVEMFRMIEAAAACVRHSAVKRPRMGQCLTLQILVFISLKLPYKIVRRTKKYVKKKLGKRNREGKIIQSDARRVVNEGIRSHRGSFRIQLDGSSVNECDGFACCMEEAEKVLEELSEKGEFQFGSFWGGEDSESCPTYQAKNETDQEVVEFQFIGSFSYV
ncbi:hypothetical protein RJ639_045852 [Escallonia herrerae]|uniref:non-specific serine/threonine protein kinase n=1 Tax=Escallonia herrerae TaxID=1293975 RepID=A0AA88WDL4_9ASTE|nr:hypothetical protein RJ639_045852 [Escallonia herrerae]